MKILVAEDDQHTRHGLAEVLEGEGYTVLTANNGKQALALFTEHAPDFVCLDIMMPEVSGYDVCREIRRFNPTVPVLFISAKSEELDKVVGLELGADDFIVKPFGLKEVIARIRAITRRTVAARGARDGNEHFSMRDLDVYPDELRARRGKKVIELSLRDVKILSLLHREAGKVVDRDAFFNECWGYDHAPNSRTLDQHVAQLRKRIERDPRNPSIISTVHGVGYRYDP